MNSMGNITQHPITMAMAVPLMDRERFAELIGVAPGVVLGWINKGYLPTVSIGKYSLVNVEALRLKAAQKAQEFTL